MAPCLACPRAGHRPLQAPPAAAARLVGVEGWGAEPPARPLAAGAGRSDGALPQGRSPPAAGAAAQRVGVGGGGAEPGRHARPSRVATPPQG